MLGRQVICPSKPPNHQTSVLQGSPACKVSDLYIHLSIGLLTGIDFKQLRNISIHSSIKGTSKSFASLIIALEPFQWLVIKSSN